MCISLVLVLSLSSELVVLTSCSVCPVGVCRALPPSLLPADVVERLLQAATTQAYKPLRRTPAPPLAVMQAASMSYGKHSSSMLASFAIRRTAASFGCVRALSVARPVAPTISLTIRNPCHVRSNPHTRTGMSIVRTMSGLTCQSSGELEPVVNGLRTAHHASRCMTVR